MKKSAYSRHNFVSAGSVLADYGIVFKRLESPVIKDNVQHNGAVKELLVDLGDHGDGVIIKYHVGSLRKI